jgi:hypothetical protein
MRFGPPFDDARRQDGRRVAHQVVGGLADRGAHRLEGIPGDWQHYAVELAAA